MKTIKEALNEYGASVRLNNSLANSSVGGFDWPVDVYIKTYSVLCVLKIRHFGRHSLREFCWILTTVVPHAAISSWLRNPNRVWLNKIADEIDAKDPNKPKDSVRVEYCIVSSCNHYILERDVNSKIANGWEPLGGIAVVPDQTVTGVYFGYYQSMIKKS